MPTKGAIQFDTESTGWKGAIDLGNSALHLAVGREADGGLEIFFAGNDYGLYHIRQMSTNGTTFTEWAGLGSFKSSGARQVAATQDVGTNLQEIFYIAANGSLYRQQQAAANDNDWTGELTFEGASARQMAVAVNTDGRLEIFYVGTDGDLYHDWQASSGNDVWAGETRFGIAFGLRVIDREDSANQISVARNSDGRLEIFYVGRNNDLYHNVQSGPSSTTWTGEQRLSGASANQVAVQQNADGRLQVFYAGTNDDLYTNWQVQPNSDSWVGEVRLSQGPVRQIAVGRNRNQELEIFYIATNGAIHHSKQTATNASSWTGDVRIENLDLATQVAVANTSDGSLALFYILEIVADGPPGR